MWWEPPLPCAEPIINLVVNSTEKPTLCLTFGHMNAIFTVSECDSIQIIVTKTLFWKIPSYLSWALAIPWLVGILWNLLPYCWINYSYPNNVKSLSWQISSKWTFFFFFFCRTHSHVLFWGHWYPCFGFLVTSPLGFKARVGSALFALRRRM